MFTSIDRSITEHQFDQNRTAIVCIFVTMHAQFNHSVLTFDFLHLIFILILIRFAFIQNVIEDVLPSIMPTNNSSVEGGRFL